MTVLPKRHGISLLALLQLHCTAAVTIGGTSVFGHKIPDTDAICAAIAYSWELNTRGIEARPFDPPSSPADELKSATSWPRRARDASAWA